MDVLVEQVYADLRAKGFKVEEVMKGGLFVASKKDRYLFFVLQEGAEVRLPELISVLNMGESLSLPVVLALVSNDGTTTYYFVRKVRLPPNPHIPAFK